MAANNPVGGCSPGGSVVQSGAMGAVELCETGGRALKLQTDTPHLVSLGGGRLSTAVTLHPIPQGMLTFFYQIFTFTGNHKQSAKNMFKAQFGTTYLFIYLFRTQKQSESIILLQSLIKLNYLSYNLVFYLISK